MKIGHQLLALGTQVLMDTLAFTWSADGAPEVIYEGLFDGRHANDLNLAGILPDVSATVIIWPEDYTAARLAVGRRLTILDNGPPREFLITAEDIQPFRVLLQLTSPDQ